MAIIHTTTPKTITENGAIRNALQSGAIWKRYFLKMLFSTVDGENDAIWKRWRQQNRHDRAPDHSTVSIFFWKHSLFQLHKTVSR